jgi:tetratricopeptide (TPR) repeat protein
MNLSKKQILSLIITGLVLATIVAYEPVRNNGFIGFDDYDYIIDNPHVNKGMTGDSVIWAFTEQYKANWHPLTWLSHMLDCRLFGLNPVGHHLVSLLFHIANTLLLFWVLKRMTDSIWASAFAAAVFALHPVHVESVTWAAERKDVLSGFFWMLTMLAYVRYAEQPNIKRYILVLLAFIMAMMSKPMAVTLPFVLLLLDYWPLERLNRSGGQETILKSVPPGRLLLEKVPLIGLSMILSAITFVVQQSSGAVIALEKIPLDYRVANMFISYIRYIGKTIWPSKLAVFYPHPHIALSEAATVICGLILVIVTIFCIDIGRRKKYLAVGWLWYIGTLVPVIGLVQAGSQGIANRYMYLPMVGLLIIVAWAVKDFVADRPRRRVAAASSAAVILICLAILTRMQVNLWQNSIKLFEYASNVTEDNEKAQTDYGIALAEAGRFDEAIPHLGEAVRINPTSYKAINYLGKVFFTKGKYNEAIECFSELIKQKKDTAEVYYNLAMALGMKGQYDESIKCFSKALEIDAGYPEIHKRLGAALLATGRSEEAVEQLNEALRTDPNQAVIYISLSIAYTRLNKYEQAIQNWTRAKELEPGSPYILSNPGWLLATASDASKEDADKAIEFARRTCEQTGYKDAELLDVLAAAYAAGGRFDDAISTAKKALSEAQARNREDQAGEIQNRIKLYETGKRYIQK